MNPSGPQDGNRPPAEATSAKRALRLFVLAVLILVLFNLVLFARFLMSSRGVDATVERASGRAGKQVQTTRTNDGGEPSGPKSH